MVFNKEAVRIDLESSKMIGEREHLLVLQSVARKQVQRLQHEESRYHSFLLYENKRWLL